MLSGVRRFLTGYRVVEVSTEIAAEVFDELYRDGIQFEREKRLENSIRFIIREQRYISAKDILCRDGVVVSEVHGLPYCLKVMCIRPVIPLGIAMFFLWMWYSSGIIWDVQVYGNTKTDEREITALLDELGCGIGDRFGDINFNQLHSDYAAVQHDIAWLSVFMNGTVAEVQVRELYRDEREKHGIGEYANIVAECDGIVEEINVFEGQAAVHAGQLVRRGQVLISGVVEEKDGEFRYEYASGEVICRTVETIRENIAAERAKKVYTGRENTEIRLRIFKKMIKLFVKGGIEGGVCDTISTMEKLCPLGLCEIPVWIEKTVSREYVSENEQISADMASEEAMLSLNNKIRRLTENAELEYKEIRSEFENGVYRIECLLYLRRDIGKTAEFTVK